MENLARRTELGDNPDPRVDEVILKELTEAGISVLNLASPSLKFSEVPFTKIGLLGHKKTVDEFNSMSRHQGWDDRGPKRYSPYFEFVFSRAWYYWCVKGYVPLTVAIEMWENPIGRKDIRVQGHCGCPDPREWTVGKLVAGIEVTDGYHIDSQKGLNLFVQTLRKHNLFKE